MLQHTAAIFAITFLAAFAAVYSLLIFFCVRDDYRFRLRLWWARQLGAWDVNKYRVKARVIEAFKRFWWAPAICVLWPSIWYDKRQRRLKKRPDKWHQADRYFSEKGIYFMTEGFLPWERY